MPSQPLEVARMFRYNSWARHKYLELFDRLPWRLLVKPQEASFGSIRDILLHTLQVNATWLESNFEVSSIRGMSLLLAEERWPSYTTLTRIHDIEAKLDRASLRFVDGLRSRDLRRKICFEIRGKKGAVTWGEGLWHMVEEELQHRGEMIALLWGEDIEPPWTNYPRWVYESADRKPPDSLLGGPNAIAQSDGGYLKVPPGIPKRAGRKLVRHST